MDYSDYRVMLAVVLGEGVLWCFFPMVFLGERWTDGEENEVERESFSLWISSSVFFYWDVFL